MKTNNPNYEAAMALIKKTKLSRDTMKTAKGRKLRVNGARCIRGLHEKLSGIADRVVITDKVGIYRGFDIVSYHFYNR